MSARKALCAAAALCALGAHAQQIADIRQGTNVAATLAPDGETLVVDLLDQLWALPATGGAARPLTPPDEVARHPRFAPNGREVVYQHRNGDQWDLRVLDLDTGASLALTSTPYDEREPDFTADGRSVVFAGNQTGHYCLWRLDIATGVLTQLTEEPGNASFPAVAMLGHVAYAREHAGTYSIRLLDPNGAASELVASRNALSAPSWRPGGGVLVFTEYDSAGAGFLKLLLLSEPRVIKPLVSGEDIFDARVSWASPAELVYSADGQIWRRGLADPARRPVHLFAAVTVQTHAPPTDLALIDGGVKQRAVGNAGAVSTADARRTVVSALGDLWLAERGSVERLTDDAFAEIGPVFTPDGESIVFASDRSGSMNLWRLELPGRALAQLTFDAQKAFAPAVSPEGRRVAYLATEGLGPWAPSELRVLDLAARGEPDARMLARGIADAERVAWDAEGRTLIVTSATGAIHRFDAASGEPSAAVTEPAPTAEPSRPMLEWSAAPAAEPFVVEVGRLFDGVRGDYRRHVDVHVAGGRIKAITARGALPAPGRVVDARDATIVPGFIDVHAHHAALAGERLGRAWLAYGVTTVREITANLPEALERAESWASGRRLGPRLVVTPRSDVPESTVAEAAAESAIAIERYPGLADGFGHSLFSQAQRYSVPHAAALSALPRFLAVPSGPHHELALSPQHTSYQDTVSRVIASATVVGSALGAVHGLGAATAGRLFVTRDSGYRTLFAAAEQERWNGASVLPPGTGLGQTLARLIRAGGRVAIGTDAPAVPYGLGLHYELALLAETGIPNDQILRLATAEGALALGLEREIGTLEEGKVADFVVLSGDPLARIADSLTITAVVKNGVWHERGALLAGP